MNTNVIFEFVIRHSCLLSIFFPFVSDIIPALFAADLHECSINFIGGYLLF
jgi:hypothetical protein